MLAKHLDQMLSIVIAAGKTDHRGSCTQGAKIQRHITCTTDAVFFFIQRNNRNGCFRGDSVHMTPHISIQHHVPNDANLHFPKRVKQFLKSHTQDLDKIMIYG